MPNRKEYKSLDDIFDDEDFHLIEEKRKASSVKTADERLASSFEEINEFVAKNGREPEANVTNVSEFQLYSRLKNLRTDGEKVAQLKSQDAHGLLPDVEDEAENEINSLDDILNDDLAEILGGDDEGLFDFKHTPKDFDRAQADFVAKRRPCKDFDRYEDTFKQVQQDLANGKRKLIPFKQENLRAGDYYVHNGVLLYLESVDFEEEVQEFSSGQRVRKDGRTRTIFENGTESNMLYRSLYKSILANGKSVTQNIDETNKEFMGKFGELTEDDKETGYIYVLRSLSQDEGIASIENLYKIGYSSVDVEQRIKNAEKEPTYLMAPVQIVSAWQCYNMNPQKFEQLLHNFFGNACLDLDVFDANGKRHRPQEWFIAPLEIIEQAVSLIISGEVVNYRYDKESGKILLKD